MFFLTIEIEILFQNYRYLHIKIKFHYIYMLHFQTTLNLGVLT